MRAEQLQHVRSLHSIEAVPIEQLADARHRLPHGTHLISPRRGYLHHGIYVGDGSVVHYSGSTRGLHRGPVEELPLEQFAAGSSLWIQKRTRYDFDAAEVVRRARARLGEDHYRVFSNNCEHFCEWCLRGEHRSYQVEALRSLPRRALRASVRAMTRLITSPAALPWWVVASRERNSPLSPHSVARAGE